MDEIDSQAAKTSELDRDISSLSISFFWNLKCLSHSDSDFEEAQERDKLLVVVIIRVLSSVSLLLSGSTNSVRVRER